MKRLLLKLFALIAIMLVSANAWAFELDYQGFTYEIYPTESYAGRGDGVKLSGAVLKSIHGQTGTIAIPSHVSYNGASYPVVGISGVESTFFKNKDVTKIVIPGTVRCVEDNTLCEMDNLKELVFEDGNEDLWMGCGTVYALKYQELTYYSDNLEKVTLGRNVVWNTDRDEPFEGKYALKTIVITPGCTHIGVEGTRNVCRRLFNSCTEVENVIIEDSDTPLFVEYCGLYMKNSAAAWNNWKNVYIGRSVQYPGWNSNDNTAYGEGYSPFYAMGNEDSEVTIGSKVTRLGNYMFTRGYQRRISCLADEVYVNRGAVGFESKSAVGSFNTVIIDQEKITHRTLVQSNVSKLIIQSSCKEIELYVNGYYPCFYGTNVDIMNIEPSSDKLIIGYENYIELSVNKLYCHRTVTSYNETSSTGRGVSVKQEAVFDDKCTSLPSNFFVDLEHYSSTIRIGNSVKRMGSLRLASSAGNNDIPTFIFEAEQVNDLPTFWDGDNLISTAFGSNGAENLPIYLCCTINPSQLNSRWNSNNYNKWHPESKIGSSSTKDNTTGLYSAVCSVCNTHDDSHLVVKEWNGTDDLPVTKENDKYIYNRMLFMDEGKPLNIPVPILPNDYFWYHSVKGGDVQGVVFPFDVDYASYVNGKVYSFAGYDGGNHTFNFRKIAADARLNAGTPYLIVLDQNAYSLLNKTIRNPLIPTVNADGTPKLFSTTVGGATFFGTYQSKETGNTYVYNPDMKNFQLKSGTVTTAPFYASIKMDNASDESVMINLIDEEGNEAIFGNSFTPVSATVEGSNGNGYANAIDGTAFTKWSGEMPDNGTPVSMEFNASEPVNVISYNIFTGDDNIGDSYNRNPESWTLYARREQADEWEPISVVTEGYLPRLQSAKSDDYEIDVNHRLNSYRYFKFEIKSVVKGSVFEIGEIYLNTEKITATINVAGAEQEYEGPGIRKGRVTSVNPVQINYVEYRLYKDYSYYPVSQPGLERTIEGYSCMLSTSNYREEEPLTIPSTVNFKIGNATVPVPVKILGENMLNNRAAAVTSISIPGTVEVTECNAFVIKDIRSIRFEDGSQPLYIFSADGAASELGSRASLENVYIGRVIEGNSMGILENSKSTNLNVTFGDGVTALQPNMFKGATGLKSITLPENLLAVPVSMCEGCRGLTAVEIPHRVASIERNAFKGCSNISSYTLRTELPPTVESNSLVGTTDYHILIPEGTIDYYLSKDDWSVYETHFFCPIHHAQSEPTACERGFAQECWENTTNGKIYSDDACNMEITGVNLAKNVTYPKRYASPVTGNVGFNIVESDNQQTWGVQLNWAAEATFENTSSVKHDDRYVEFKAGNDYAGNARLVWMKNQGAPEQGRFTVNIYVNDVLKQTYNQNNNEYLEGVVVVPLTGLAKGDIVKFEVQQNSYASYAEAGPTFKASLEYTLSYCTLVANENPDEQGKHYTTYYDGRSAYSLPETAKAYTGIVTDDQLILTPIEDNIIPKGEAVIIRSTSGNIALTPSDSDKAKNTENALSGSDTDTTAPANCYILSYGQNSLGFYKYAEGKTLAAHKAYLTYSASELAKGLRMVFANGEADGIENINEIDNDNENNAIYNLQGVRLNKLQKGINIVGGKKIIVK